MYIRIKSCRYKPQVKDILIMKGIGSTNSSSQKHLDNLECCQKIVKLGRHVDRRDTMQPFYVAAWRANHKYTNVIAYAGQRGKRWTVRYEVQRS